MSSSRRLGLLSRALDAVLGHLPRDGIAVKAEERGGVANTAFRALQGAGDEHPLELAAGIVIVDAAIQHLLDERIQLITHG